MDGLWETWSVPHPCPRVSTDQPKAVVVLDPPWDHILEKDRVELMCQGPPGPKDNFTQWWFNSSALAQQTSPYVITAASVLDSGDYSCQTGLSAPSEPRQLQVHKGKWAVGPSRGHCGVHCSDRGSVEVQGSPFLLLPATAFLSSTSLWQGLSQEVYPLRPPWGGGSVDSQVSRLSTLS